MAQSERIHDSNQVYFFTEIDSTNIYANNQIEKGLAGHGDTFWALTQLKGRGQRGKVWQDTPGNSLLMSLIVEPKDTLAHQFRFNMLISLAIAKYLQTRSTDMVINIKWPNDIYINDKKAVGVLIENVVRGSNWNYAIIGMGVNVKQANFPKELPNATSLKIATGKDFELEDILLGLRSAILDQLSQNISFNDLLNEYNQYLFKRGQSMHFRDRKTLIEFTAIVVGINDDGALLLENNNGVSTHQFGTLDWVL